jgi:hypothetical protein
LASKSAGVLMASKLVALIDQILDELALQITFALVAFGDLPFSGVLSRTMKLLDSAMVL